MRSLTIEPRDPTAAAWTVTAHLAGPVPAGAQVRVLWKSFDSGADWQAVDTVPGDDGGFAATISGGGAGGQFAAEIVSDVGGWRYPNAVIETPYVVLPP